MTPSRMRRRRRPAASRPTAITSTAPYTPTESAAFVPVAGRPLLDRFQLDDRYGPDGVEVIEEGTSRPRRVDLWEVVRARGLHQLAPELWPVMLVDENGYGKGLPLSRRGGELYGADAIAGDALICQERRSTFSVDELTGFTEEEAEQLRDLVFRRTGRGRG